MLYFPPFLAKKIVQSSCQPSLCGNDILAIKSQNKRTAWCSRDTFKYCSLTLGASTLGTKISYKLSSGFSKTSYRTQDLYDRIQTSKTKILKLGALMNWKVPVLRSGLLYLMGQVYQAHLKQFPGLHSFQDGGYIVTRR